VRRIAGRQEIENLALAFEKSLRNPSKSDRISVGSRLATQLFGEFFYPQRTTPFWTVVVEDSIARIPMSALPLPGDPTRFLLEAHTLRFVPSALFLQPSPVQQWTGRATAFADPIYNTTDERLPHPLATPQSVDSLQLNRLPASYQEAQLALQSLSQRNWRVQLNAGQTANVEALRRHLQASPDILHIAAHFGMDPQRPDLLSIALSSPAHPGQSALFGALDLSALRSNTKLVSLDGCASGLGNDYPGHGKAHPGHGIIGLSRAFLLSGARNVLGTLWPIEDLSGPLFPDFYRQLSSAPYSSRALSAALRKTQLDLMKRQDRYSAPSYWAAYQLLQRN
jgi:CHAT domain-containing protein